jgi:hypothetical protein
MHHTANLSTLLGVAAAIPVFCGCARVNPPAPVADGSAPLAQSSALPAPASAAAAPTAAQAAPSAAQAAPSATSAATAEAPASARPAATSPRATSEDCSRFETAPEFSSLPAEDRARSRMTCETKEEFRAFVATRQTCAAASDCTNVSGACPFGCYIPVAKASAADVQSKLEKLGKRLDEAGHRCVYRCMGPPSEACVEGRCATGAR